MAQGHYELKTAKDGQFMFNLIATNGQVILTSELYKTKASAQNGIASVQKNGVDKKNFEFRMTKSDQRNLICFSYSPLIGIFDADL